MEKKSKQFLRTIPGKFLLFLIINILGMTAFGCVCASAVCIQEDFYDITEEEYYQTKDDSFIYYNAIAETENLVGINNYHVENMSIEVKDEDGKLIASTRDYKDVSVAAGKSGEFANYKLYTFDMNLVYGEDGEYKHSHDSYSEPGDVVVKATVNVYANTEALTQFSAFDRQIVHLVISSRYIIYPIGILSVIAAIAAFVALMCVTGKKPGSEEIALGPVGRIPFDLLVAGFIFVSYVGVFIAGSAPGRFEIIFGILLIFLVMNMMLGLCVTFAARVKLRTLIKGLLIYKIIMLIGKFFKLIIKGILSIPLIWRTVLIFGGISFFEIIVMAASGFESDVISIGWFFEKLLLGPAILYIALMLRKLKIAGDKLAAGDITYRASTKGLWGDFKKHAVNLNAVSDSVTIAVEERLKSERMKTELITNVSHDIKTPLTSIINYASLMGTTDPSDPKMSEYSEVVVRQSEKLKRLIEDLVEASKASTGNLEIVPAPLDCCTFVSQTAGEYKEKIENAGLTLVTNAPEEPVMIMADGRRMMRIYDNLMNNICKYSQPGTRVYLTLEVINGVAVTTFKNTSSAELNISADELVERFVRGDQSRNTEGNGLGLSIAKSMTELQGGKFNIDIDGDLFKVTLSFPFTV
ncbi:Signal transduction histidine kinase [Ruminococcaceae bacterium YAD3003]|nr:Signal transduction histidine kinase [Ruminococcaceae bacterium YAD3003]